MDKILKIKIKLYKYLYYKSFDLISSKKMV